MGRKQLAISGTEPKSIKEVDAAAEGYVDARDKRMERTEKEVEARDALIAVMKKHKLDVYRDDSAAPPLLVTLVPGDDRVKVTRVQDEGEDADA